MNMYRTWDLGNGISATVYWPENSDYPTVIAEWDGAEVFRASCARRDGRSIVNGKTRKWAGGTLRDQIHTACDMVLMLKTYLSEGLLSRRAAEGLDPQAVLSCRQTMLEVLTDEQARRQAAARAV